MHNSPDSDVMAVAAPEQVVASAELAGRSQAEARRLRMREFQSHLQTRLADALQSERKESAQLGLMVGESRFLTDLKDAGEIFSAQSITTVPLTHDWYLGLTNLRGVLTNVIDLVRFYGGPLTPVDRDARIVAFAPLLGINTGLLVSRVLGLRDTASMQVCENTTRPEISAKDYIDSNGHLWSEIHFSNIIQNPKFLDIGR